ncbi:putative late blight resistance protein homolog R1B-17 [Andrographis paniculata]|uniref:putative late blight resistance protein homolog R1B-17 n=1 Tax=Andrographis paniculata TaxID=175694 RepID=UPI0021E7DF6F|nr:putative late blight resistance protein homolog R1B-17 [Andrographis paniculata]
MGYYAALASLVHLLEEIVHRDRYPNILLGKHPIVKSLLEKFSLLEASLQDYSSEGDEVSDRVEAHIREVAYRAQDVIESNITGHIDFRSDVTIKKIYPLIFCCQDLFWHLRTEECNENLRDVEQKVDYVVDELKMAVAEERQQISRNLQIRGCSTVLGVAKLPKGRSRRDDVMVGFDEYLTIIKDQLCGHSSQLQVIPVVGMGGIGKTTLARAAFDDPRSVYHFDRRAWVTVTQDYDVIGVLCSILKNMGVNIDGFHGEDEDFLKEHIYKHLIGRRYLLVIDDVWSTEVWDDTKNAFPNVSDGSRILLTTRLSDVAHYVRSSEFLHEMQFLDVDTSWNLLREKVFAQEQCPLELEEVGKFIASKCRGLPLAIVVIAGVLSDVRTLHHWEEVARNVNSFLNKSGDENLSNILSLSYNQLSHLLKACFLYLGSFPEDYEINVCRLTRLWVAEGFLKSVESSKTLEQVAEECLEDLVKRNLVLVLKKSAIGRFKYCMMHDLLRDFCRQRAVQECFFHGLDWKKCFDWYEESIRQNTEVYDFHKPWLDYGARNRVRTILWFSRAFIDNGFLFGCLSFRLLKILDVSDAELSSVPQAVSSMFHLRYIAVKRAGRQRFHLRRIFKLWNLQTIVILDHCSKLPTEFWQKLQLRHVISTKTMILPPIPKFTPVLILEHLQTLETVKDFVYTKKAVEIIPNLRKLKMIITDGGDEFWKKYCLGNLVHLTLLEELKICFDDHFKRGRTSLKDNIVFPLNLKKLSLSGCRISWNKMTAVGSLPSLQVLRINDDAFTGQEWEPIEGEFRQLKFLLMKGLDLKIWRADNTHFPLLRRLKIIKCIYLEEIPMEIGEISLLESITVYDCSREAEDSAKLILEEQQSLGNDMLQVLVNNKLSI